MLLDAQVMKKAVAPKRQILLNHLLKNIQTPRNHSF